MTTRALTRRRFLGAVTAAAGTFGMSATSGIARAEDERRCRVLIVGAGLGGCIAAYRFAAAGIENVVLERGRRWPITESHDTFPEIHHPDQRSFWLDGVLPTAGCAEYVVGEHVDVICGSGVGGGTLTYAGMLPQPRGHVFERVFPSALDFQEMDAVYYPRARARLVCSPTPDDVLAHPRYRSNQRWAQLIAAAGTDHERMPINFDWDVIRDELNGRVPAAATVGQYLLTGCNSGAKMSADRTYLARAEASGLTTVEPLHQITDVAPADGGGYRVGVQRLGGDGVPVERITYRAEKVVFAAGAVHTPRLLVRLRDTGFLPDLSPETGCGWGTNGDRWLVLADPGDDTGAPQAGPPALIVRDDTDPDRAAGLVHGPFPFPVNTGALLALGMGIPQKPGTVVFDPAAGVTRLEWSPDSDSTATRDILRVAERITAARSPAAQVIDSGNIRQMTVHPLGGAVLGQATDMYGRLHGYSGLYCIDGALLPGSSAAVNPALTIAALAERCLDNIITRDFG